jgi:hypothetical protein
MALLRDARKRIPLGFEKTAKQTSLLIAAERMKFSGLDGRNSERSSIDS